MGEGFATLTARIELIGGKMSQYHSPSIPPPPPLLPPYSLWIALTAVVVFLASAMALFLWVGRRHFYRTNSAGVEEFKNYSSAVLSHIVEGVVTLLAGACLLAGVFSGLCFFAFLME